MVVRVEAHVGTERHAAREKRRAVAFMCAALPKILEA